MIQLILGYLENFSVKDINAKLLNLASDIVLIQSHKEDRFWGQNIERVISNNYLIIAIQ